MDEQLKYFYPLYLISGDVPPLTQSILLNPPRHSIYGLNQPPDNLFQFNPLYGM